MLRLTEIKLPLDHDEPALKEAILRKLGIDAAQLKSYTVFRRGYDARRRDLINLIYTLDVATTDDETLLARHADDPHVVSAPDTRYKFVAHAPENLPLRPVVIGLGPCGLFAGLILSQMGFRPIILERGKEVRQRTQDTWGLWRKRTLNPESNVQFGEGGAGTFSDGKLYSQIKDPGHRGRKVLTEFIKAGAPEEILYVSKPHIGTFKLVTMVENMRNTILALGGEIRFEARVKDIAIEEGHVRGVTLSNDEFLRADHVVLAVGHSARDTFQMLYERSVYLEAKPFSIGFRIEHPQSLIDKCRFGKFAGHPLLGAADYKLVHHCKNGRSVYSFCMCPGGTVVAATSEEGRVVTNGMSQYSRNERNANAAIVVGITPEDYLENKSFENKGPGNKWLENKELGNKIFGHNSLEAKGHENCSFGIKNTDVKSADACQNSPLAGIDFQRDLESKAYELGGSNYNAPGQLVGDFIADRPSTAFGSVLPSYRPGVTLGDLSLALPAYAIEAIREALPAFDKKIKGFAMQDALLTGVETRTSSPVRVKRGDDYQSLNTKGLFPAGEGAGYAGGILSAAVDGIEVAEAVAQAISRGKN